MNKRNYLILAVLGLGLAIQLPMAKASQESDLLLDSEVSENAEKVCFCHNVNHEPHTICTADEALIQAHMDHVNGEVPGVEDELGECPEEEPSEETPLPTEDPLDPEDPQNPEDPEAPGDEGSEDVDGEDIPGKVDEFGDGAEIVDDYGAVNAGQPYFEGSGCTLNGPAAGGSQLIPWALLTLMFLSPLRKIRK